MLLLRSWSPELRGSSGIRCANNFFFLGGSFTWAAHRPDPPGASGDNKSRVSDFQHFPQPVSASHLLLSATGQPSAGQIEKRGVSGTVRTARGLWGAETASAGFRRRFVRSRFSFLITWRGGRQRDTDVGTRTPSIWVWVVPAGCSRKRPAPVELEKGPRGRSQTQNDELRGEHPDRKRLHVGNERKPGILTNLSTGVNPPSSPPDPWGLGVHRQSDGGNLRVLLVPVPCAAADAWLLPGTRCNHTAAALFLQGGGYHLSRCPLRAVSRAATSVAASVGSCNRQGKSAIPHASLRTRRLFGVSAAAKRWR